MNNVIWKLLFLVYSSLILWNLLFEWAFSWGRILSAILFGFMILPFYGLGFRKPIFTKTIWNRVFYGYFIFFLIAIILGNLALINNHELLGDVEASKRWINLATSCIFFGVAIFGMYRYAKKSNDIW